MPRAGGVVVLRDRPGSRIDRLCFGNPLDEPPGPRKGGAEQGSSVVQRFPPGRCFGLVRWTRDKDGRQHRFLLIASFEPGGLEPIAVRDVRPAPVVHALIAQDGPAGTDGPVDELLDLIAALRRRGEDPADVSPEVWRRLIAPILMREPVDEAMATPVTYTNGGRRRAATA